MAYNDGSYFPELNPRSKEEFLLPFRRIRGCTVRSEGHLEAQVPKWLGAVAVLLT